MASTLANKNLMNNEDQDPNTPSVPVPVLDKKDSSMERKKGVDPSVDPSTDKSKKNKNKGGEKEKDSVATPVPEATKPPVSEPPKPAVPEPTKTEPKPTPVETKPTPQVQSKPEPVATPAPVSVPDKQVAPQKQATGLVKVNFVCHCDITNMGDNVCVTGSSKSLGEWSEQMPLSGDNFPKWSGTFEVDRDVEYKYTIRQGDGSVRWETCEGNRTLEQTSESAITVEATPTW